MKRKLIILAGLFMVFQFGFSLSCMRPSYYDVKDGKVMYYGMGRLFKELKEVDVETFKMLDGRLGKDKNNVYYEGNIMKNIDPETFEIIYAKPKRKIERNPAPSCGTLGNDNFKDKNGTYSIWDIRTGKLKLEE